MYLKKLFLSFGAIIFTIGKIITQLKYIQNVK